MKTTNGLLDYCELIQELDNLVLAQGTGTVYILGDAKSVSFGLDDGRIVSCSFGRFQGMDAVSHIQGIRSGQFSFVDGLLRDADSASLPPTSELLETLKSAVPPGADSASAALVPAAIATPQPAPTPVAGPSEVITLRGDALFETIANELALHLGPMARIVASGYQRAILGANHVDQVRILVNQIGRDIGNPAQAEAFAGRVLKRLAG